MKIKKFRVPTFRKLACLICFITLGIFQSASHAAVITASVSNSNVLVGDTVDVDFSISGLTGSMGDSLSAFDFDVLFDDSVFLFTGYHFTDPASGLNNHRLKAGGFELRTESPDTRRLNDAS